MLTFSIFINHKSIDYKIISLPLTSTPSFSFLFCQKKYCILSPFALNYFSLSAEWSNNTRITIIYYLSRVIFTLHPFFPLTFISLCHTLPYMYFSTWKPTTSSLIFPMCKQANIHKYIYSDLWQNGYHTILSLYIYIYIWFDLIHCFLWVQFNSLFEYTHIYILLLFWLCEAEE